MLIVGLGNIGAEYENTYHNIGFAVIDELLLRLGLKMKEKSCSAEHVQTFIKSEKVVFAKPRTYMNLSGQAVQELSSFYNIPLSKTLVVYDDIDIPAGVVRVRTAGSGGTHNGMKNVIATTHSVLIPRMRIGVGAPPENIGLVNYVLSKISAENSEPIRRGVQAAAEIIIGYLNGNEIQNSST